MDRSLALGALNLAYREARVGSARGDGGPFGAVIIDADGRIIAKAHNQVLKDCDPTGHAETLAIRRAAKKLGTPHLTGCVLVASSEPCPMCLTVAYWAQIKEVAYALPASVAAKAGFSDVFIYRELAKASGKRKLKLTHLDERQGEGRAIFQDWVRGKGKTY
jgi:guanine deaminase